jgi:hypothetical protein
VDEPRRGRNEVILGEQRILAARDHASAAFNADCQPGYLLRFGLNHSVGDRSQNGRCYLALMWGRPHLPGSPVFASNMASWRLGMERQLRPYDFLGTEA